MPPPLDPAKPNRNEEGSGAFDDVMLSFCSTGGVNSFYQAPVAYIGELGEDATVANATDYVVDAWSYGGSQSTVAVVESVYQIIRPVASATSP